MTDLSPDAKELFRQARHAFSPSDRQLEALRTALSARIEHSPIESGSTAAGEPPASRVVVKAVGAPALGGGHLAAALVTAAGAGIAAWLAFYPAPRGSSGASVEAPQVATPRNASGASVHESTLAAEPEHHDDAPRGAVPTGERARENEAAIPLDSAPLAASARGPASELQTATGATRGPSLGRAKGDSSRLHSPRREAPKVDQVLEPAPRSTPPTAAATAVPVPTSNDAVEPPDSLGEEIRMLRDARRALERGDATEALRLLQGHEHRFPRGTLYEERLATRVQALCAAGKVDGARAAARELESTAPRSPHLGRVRASCIAVSGK